MASSISRFEKATAYSPRGMYLSNIPRSATEGTMGIEIDRSRQTTPSGQMILRARST